MLKKKTTRGTSIVLELVYLLGLRGKNEFEPHPHSAEQGGRQRPLILPLFRYT